ncbi:hypothetical protein [Halobacillus seohaensis]|uniref:Uncharacterized protein n=1 Tax=Halobacillus seohaensis TaxID=447421 RepID=A0ABW2EI79_9BACI
MNLRSWHVAIDIRACSSSIFRSLPNFIRQTDLLVIKQFGAKAALLLSLIVLTDSYL